MNWLLGIRRVWTVDFAAQSEEKNGGSEKPDRLRQWFSTQAACGWLDGEGKTSILTGKNEEHLRQTC